MILNVSGRTDVIAFFSPWFLNRYHAGFVDVRNPFYPKMVSRISFHKVDAIIFCTKNPIPFLEYMDEMKHPFVLQVTLTPYRRDIEPFVPDKSKVIEAIQKISQKIGTEFIYVRYDPIFLNDQYTIEYHCKAFEKMCRLLHNSVKHIIVSFIDNYKNVERHQDDLHLKKMTSQDLKRLGWAFGNIVQKYGMTIQTCTEEERLTEYGFLHRDCVDEELAYLLTGKVKWKRWKARGNDTCHCVEMVDIGAYNTCKHYCKYCYANYDELKIQERFLNHDPMSTMLVGHLEADDIVKERK